MESYDYVLIGGGIAGLSSAYHLSKDGHRVLLLEATDASDSASMASTAEMNHDPDADWVRIIEDFGLDGAKQLWSFFANGIDAMSEFAHQLGEPHFSASRLPAYTFSYTDTGIAILQKKYELYKSIGANVTLEASPQHIHPNFRAVLTTHGEGVTNNQMLLKTLHRLVREWGGIIRTHQKVTHIEDTLVTTASGETYTGMQVIIATGDGAEFLPASVQVEQKRTFVVSFEKEDLPELFRDCVSWDTDEPYHYIRSFAGNRVWVGGEDVFESAWHSSKEKEEQKYEAIRAYARDILGIDATYTRQAAWSGKFYPATRTLPYIGAVPGTAHIANVGFGGTGIITSFLSGMLIAAWKRGELLDYQKFFSLHAEFRQLL